VSRLWLPDDTPTERVLIPFVLVAGAVLSVLVRAAITARRRWAR
jgi:hypothetical protein